MQVTEAVDGTIGAGDVLRVEVRILSLSFNGADGVGAAWLAASSEAIKAVYSAIVGGTRERVYVTAGGRTWYFADGPYAGQRAQLPKFNTWQLILRTWRPSFLLGDLHQAVGDYLLSPAFTTPVLPEWVPYIVQQATKDGLLRECHHLIGMAGHECNLTTMKLDKIVSNGIKKGALRIVDSRTPMKAGR